VRVPSRMYSEMDIVWTMISIASDMAPPSVLGSSRCETVACSASDSRPRTACCSSTGKNESSRLMVLMASVVCTAESTRWPISAALSAMSTVSWSRSSPTRMTSGSCRGAERMAAAKSAGSCPSSRCERLERMLRCMNSMGSSMVRMGTESLRLMWSTIAASGVDLPAPVLPVTRMRPRSFDALVRWPLDAMWPCADMGAVAGQAKGPASSKGAPGLPVIRSSGV
jgi:hypothetical protein